jgi:hypothetical protein
MRKARKRGYLTDFMGESPKARLGGGEGGIRTPETQRINLNTNVTVTGH